MIMMSTMTMMTNMRVMIVSKNAIEKYDRDEKFGIEKSIGFGIRNKMVLKKYWIRYRKYLVSDSVSENIWYRKNIGFSIGNIW